MFTFRFAVFIITTMALPRIASANELPTPSLEAERAGLGAVIISWNDRAKFRWPSNERGPEMGGGKEDFHVRLSCMDIAHC